MQKKECLLIPSRTEELELPTLKTVTYNETSMNLTLDKHQYLNGGGNVVLPAITDTSKVYEIHLYVLSSTDATINVTSADNKGIMWDEAPNPKPYYVNEFIFTFVNWTWVAGVIVYNKTLS